MGRDEIYTQAQRVHAIGHKIPKVDLPYAPILLTVNPKRMMDNLWRISELANGIVYEANSHNEPTAPKGPSKDVLRGYNEVA